MEDGYQFKELETEKEYGNVYNIYRRERLYEEVWNRPITDVAKHYHVSNTAIRKVCKSMNIPVPGLGYWSIVRSEKKAKKTRLPAHGIDEKRGLQNSKYNQDETDSLYGLDFMKTEEKESVINASLAVQLPSEVDRIPRKISTQIKLLNCISKDSKKRISMLVTALYNALQPLGCELHENLCFTINGESLKIHFTEGQKKINHELTKAENKELLHYEEALQKRGWASKPYIPKYDYEYTGRLTLYCGEKRWRDGQKVLLEKRLSEIVIGLFAEAERTRIKRLEKEETERKRKEEELQRIKRRERYNDEIDCTLELINEAEDYEIACKIRAYINAVQNNPNSNTSINWINWARKKADWFDPSVDFEDELLGKRNHKTSAENKKLVHRYYGF